MAGAGGKSTGSVRVVGAGIRFGEEGIRAGSDTKGMAKVRIEWDLVCLAYNVKHLRRLSSA